MNQVLPFSSTQNFIRLTSRNPGYLDQVDRDGFLQLVSAILGQLL